MIYCIIVAVAAVYLIFIAGPAIVSFFTVFTRKECPPLDEFTLSGTYYEPYSELLLDRYHRLKTEPHDEVSVKASDGTILAGEMYRSGGQKLAVLLHGYRSSPQNTFCVQACDLLDNGFDVLLIYERAHGKSSGKRSSLGILESGDLLTWIKAMEETYSGIFVWGISMGCTAAVYASPDFPSCVKCAVYDCGFLSPYAQLTGDCLKRHLPAGLLLPVISLLAKVIMGIYIRKDASESMSHSYTPALFFHGESDRSVPVESGKTLYRSCPAEKASLFLSGADHTLTYVAGGEMAKNKLFEFLNRHIS